MSNLDARIAELAAKYLPLASEMLKEAIRIPADYVDKPVDQGGDPACGTSNHEFPRLEYLRNKVIEIKAVRRPEDAFFDDFGKLHDTADSKHGFAAPVVRPELMRAVETVAARLWPGTPVIPVMDPSASDAAMAAPYGIPVYAVSGDSQEADDGRAHGQDERVGVAAFDRGVDFYYRFLKALLGKR